MYQPYPTSAQIPHQQPQTRPASVQNAVRIMYAGGVASLVSAGVEFATRQATRANILAHFPKLAVNHPGGMTGPVAVGAIGGGVIAAILWIVIAQACKGGRNWARVTGTVFFGIATIDLLGDVAFPFAAAVKIVALVVWLLGLAAVVLLWRRSSAPYFRGSRP
jgi:hypothetical protein